jgi:hypothetical protein
MRNEIYNRYIGRDSFESSLSLIQDILSTMLRDEYTKIWVQASKSGSVKFCFTIFNRDRTYEMVFVTMKNFRMWRGNNTDKIDFEIESMEKIIDYLIVNGLMDYINC